VTGFHRFTPLRITIPFILGIVIMIRSGTVYPVGYLPGIPILIFLLLLPAYLFFRTSYRFRWVYGLLVNIALFLTGAYLVASTRIHNQPPPNQEAELSRNSLLLCRIELSPVARTNSFTAHTKVVSRLDSLGKWQKVDRKAILYFKTDSLSTNLHYGDMILVSGALRPVPATSNPDAFNYRQYLQNQGIYFQLFVEPEQWKYVGIGEHNPIKAGAELCRNEFLDVFRLFGIEGQEFALAAALLLGSRDFLEKETEKEFSNAGAVHVLSVSGLHVGIMYVVIDKLLFFLKRGRISRKLHHVLIILCIWAYAFISGLPSSVIRAAMMFSLVAAGNMMKRNPENYNILAVAAFLQLLIDPFEITRVGFQLSYLAVLGIFAFYKPLNELISPKNGLAAWTWSIIAVSIAAQLVTFPLGSYYFHMFPVYFLLTNMIVVPLAAVITYFAVFLLIAGAAGLSFHWLAWPLNWSLRFMIDAVEWIQNIPGAVIDQIVFSQFQVMLIYVFIASLFAWLILSYRKIAFILPLCILVFSLSLLGQQFDRLTTSEIVVYSIPGHTAIDLIHKRKTVFLCDSVLTGIPGKVNYSAGQHRLMAGVNSLQVFELDDVADNTDVEIEKLGPFIYFYGKSLAIIDREWKDIQPSDRFKADIGIITGLPRVKFEDILTQIIMKQIIIDSSIPAYKADKIRESCMNAGIPCHSVRKDGAFVMKW
jgi:competence protein ComEC